MRLNLLLWWSDDHMDRNNNTYDEMLYIFIQRWIYLLFVGDGGRREWRGEMNIMNKYINKSSLGEQKIVFTFRSIRAISCVNSFVDLGTVAVHDWQLCGKYLRLTAPRKTRTKHLPAHKPIKKSNHIFCLHRVYLLSYTLKQR